MSLSQYDPWGTVGFDDPAWAGDWASGFVPTAGGGGVGDTGNGFGVNISGQFSSGGGGPDAAEICTQIVNSYEPGLAQNRDAFLAGQVSTSQALSFFDSNFERMTGELVQFGETGYRSLRERQRGGRWDWYALYRDPISRDSSLGLVGATPLSGSSWLVIAALAIALYLILRRM